VPVIVTTTDYDGNPVTSTVTHTITIKNPCIDPANVNIKLPDTLAILEYIIDTGPKTYASIAVGDDVNFVKTEPVNHNLCGDLKFWILYDSLPNDESVLTYDENDLDFTAESTDGTLIGLEKTYAIVAEFEDYPGAPQAQSVGTIKFVSPCKASFTLNVNPQTYPAADKFSGTPIVALLNPFSIVPSRCKVSYACTSVARKDL
jgi:hypothetical protein